MFQFEQIIMPTLLVVDTILILIILKEIAELHKTQDVTTNAVDTIVSSVRLLRRDQIYFYLSKTAREATVSIHHLSIAHSTSEIRDEEERNRVVEFLDALKSASNDISDIKILGPDLSERIGGLWERKKCGAEVKVSPTIATYDIRVQIVDGEKTVIGIGPPEMRSEYGFLIESRVLANLLEREFMEIWRKARELDEHIENVILRHVELLIHYNRLRNLVRSSLNVPSTEMVDELINLLLNKKSLIRMGNNIYNYKIIKEICKKTSCTPDNLMKFINKNYRITISKNHAEKIIYIMANHEEGV